MSKSERLMEAAVMCAIGGAIAITWSPLAVWLEWVALGLLLAGLGCIVAIVRS